MKQKACPGDTPGRLASDRKGLPESWENWSACRPLIAPAPYRLSCQAKSRPTVIEVAFWCWSLGKFESRLVRGGGLADRMRRHRLPRLVHVGHASCTILFTGKAAEGLSCPFRYLVSENGLEAIWRPSYRFYGPIWRISRAYAGARFVVFSGKGGSSRLRLRARIGANFRCGRQQVWFLRRRTAPRAHRPSSSCLGPPR